MDRTKKIMVGDQVLGGGLPFLLIAGPCVIESREILFATADALCEIARSVGIGLVFKSSYDKANRSSVNSFRGPGFEEGIKMLLEVREKFGIPITTDVHSADEARRAGEWLDMIQVPALLSRQTDIILAAGNTGRAVNIKKGQFMSPWDVVNIYKKLESTKNSEIIITERGTTFGYNNLVVDMRSLEIMRGFGYPVVFDATHVVQSPGGGGDKSSGDSRYIPALARAAAAVGIDGLFMEVHPDPDSALCDGQNMIGLDSLKSLLVEIKRIDDVVKK